MKKKITAALLFLVSMVAYANPEVDTVGYCSDSLVQALREENGTVEWGIRIPASLRQARQLTAVQIYCIADGDYILTISQGESIDYATPVYTKVYSLDSDSEWRTLELDSVLTIHRTQTIWITISMTDDGVHAPLAAGTYGGNPDGSWYHYPQGWGYYYPNYSWLMRAILLPVRMLNVAASPNDINLGDVSGMGIYYPGDTVILRAEPKPNARFVEWSNGSTLNPQIFIITDDTLFIAVFEDLNGIAEAGRDRLTVSVRSLTVTIDNPDHRRVALFDITGRHLSTTHSTHSTFTLPATGIYILKADGLPARRIVVIE